MNTIHTIIKQRISLVVILLGLLLSGLPAIAQVHTNVVTPPTGPPAVATVSGPSTIPQGTASSNYTETGLTTGSFDSFTWSLSNSSAGTITGGSYNLATVTWNPSFTGSVGIQFSATNSYGTTPGNTKTTYVYVNPVISPASSSINYNDKPTLSMTSAVDAGGSYQWQSSPDGSSWANITGAYGTSYTPAAGLTSTTYYRLTDFNDGVGGGYTATSNTSTVTVYPQLVAGAVLNGLGDQTVYYNHGAAVGCQPPTGGNGSYTYLWQSSPDGGTWTTIPGAAATTSIVTPVITAKTYFHVIQSSNFVSVTGPTITVSVYPQIQAGTLSPLTQAVNYSMPAATIVGQPATGGNGTFTYQWQSSATGAAGSWANVPGATASSYVPGNGIATTYFHLVSTAPNGDLVTSATALITVYPQLVTGTITPLTQSIYYGAPPALSCAEASGGNGAKTHQWQSSPTGVAGTFTNVPLATGLTLPTTGLTATTYFQLISSNSGVNVTSSVATVTVYPQLATGTATTSTPTVYYSKPPALSATEATGGNGTKTHQWQSSPSGTAGSFANITGATSLTSPTVPAITATTWYQLLTTNGPATVTSNALAVAVYPQLVTGIVIPATQSIYYNTPPATFSCTEASGGNGVKTHQWQASPVSANGVYTSIPGDTSLTHIATPLTEKTFFRMVTTNNGVMVNSAPCSVTVYAQLVTGTVTPATQSINYGGSASITGTEAAGGNGTKTHQWQSSPSGTAGTFTNVPLATGLILSTGALTATTYYQLVTTNNSVSVTSSAAAVTVYPQVAGLISPASQAIVINTKPGSLLCTPSGGNGTYTYQWQSSADNVTFTNIGSATANTYIPDLLSATTYYRVLVSSNGATANSAVSSVIVTECVALASAPQASMNYITSSTIRTSGVTSVTGPSQLAAMSVCDVNQTIQYLDGLGRPIQVVQVKGSPSDNDLVQPVVYDQFGREASKYLLYTSAAGNPGSYRPDALAGSDGAYGTSKQKGFYGLAGQSYTSISSPLAVTSIEPSPLNRVVEQGAPGDTWQIPTSGTGHTVKITYTVNNTTVITDTANTLKAALYTAQVNSDQSRTLLRTGNSATYNAGQLYVTIKKDENWTSGRAGTVEEYKDMQGKVVLKRTFNFIPGTPVTLQILSTYYVYDDWGNLAFVLPPGASPDSNVAISQTALDNLCYQYRYDERNRLIQKKMPGKGWEYMVYNRLGQLVLSQDAVQRNSNQWTVAKYDAQGRVIMTGLYNAGSVIPLATLQTSIYAASQWDLRNYSDNITGYTISSYPALNQILTINYYDNYNNIPGLPAGFTAPANASTKTTGLLTASKTAILNTPANMLCSEHYYDDLGRTIKSYQQHYLGGTLSAYNYDEVTSSYSFTNAITQTIRKHHTAAATGNVALTITNRYGYDHMGRRTTTREQIQNAGQAVDTLVLVSKIDYNEVGQVWKKHLHSTDSINFRQDVVYSYNERGWLSKSSAPLFEEQLLYNTGLVKQYNGNIVYQSWGTGAVPDSKTYTYGYDMLNRLTSANSTDNYNENNITYDLMGNIQTLNRYSGSATVKTDQLTYSYLNGTNPTNQLQSIADNSGSNTGIKAGTSAYAYDLNGNVTTDASRSTGAVTVGYNLFNLPQTVTGAKTITYTYDANGQKLRRASAGTGNTDYVSGIQYDGTTTQGLSFIQTDEGTALPTGASSYNYEYNLSDHLGNTRVTFDTGTGSAISRQQDDYYAFGMEIPRSLNGTKNEYLYNKKELQEELGQYDYGARFYDPAIARWTTIDPFADKYPGISAYNYVTDNPIRRVDPDGRDVTFDITRNKNGEITAVSVRATVYIKGSGASAKRASELTKAAKKQFSAGKSENGTSVSFNVNYQYDESKTAGDLKSGENLLTFSAEREHDVDPDKTKIRRSEVTDDNGKGGGTGLGANVGTVYSSGESDYSVLHETGHLLSLSDQYVDDPSDYGPPYAYKKGVYDYATDLMATNGQFGFNTSYYQSFLNKASVLLKTTVTDGFFASPLTTHQVSYITGTTNIQIPFSGFVNTNLAIRIPDKL